MRYVPRTVRYQKCPPRPLTAWAPTQNPPPSFGFPVLFVPWRIWTIRR